MTRARLPRGLVLPTVLLVSFLVVLLAMTMVSVAGLDYRLARQRLDRLRAFEAAQAALAEASYNLIEDGTWGTHEETLQETLASDGSRYVVTFSPQAGVAWSTNNLGNPSPVAGCNGQAVPPRAVLILATGTGPGGQAVVLEALFEAAPLPFAIAATGRVAAGDYLQVDAASSLAELLDGRRDGSASLYAGARSADALVGGLRCTISGEVRTPGSARLGMGSQVEQGIVQNAGAERIPDIPIADYSTARHEGRTELAPGVYTGKTRLSGPVYVRGDILFRGDLTLDGAVVFVDAGGSFASQGNLHGTGSIFSTGSVYLRGNVDIVASDGIAVFSDDRLVVGGGSFQGLLYSHRAVVGLSRMSVMGAVVCSSGDGDDSISLGSNVHVTYVPEYARLLGTPDSTAEGLHMTFWRERRP